MTAAASSTAGFEDRIGILTEDPTVRDQIDRRLLRRAATSRDASHYQLLPAAVATPRTVADLADLVVACRRAGVPLTPRSGGTSLSGQSVGAGIVIDVRRHWQEVHPGPDGTFVRAQVGATIDRVNRILTPSDRRLGPDPASDVACTIGGVVANNSSGMCCGTTENAYSTIQSLVCVLASGTVVDTSASEADARLREEEPELYRALGSLRDRVRGSAEMSAAIRQRFAIKNTMGYSINALTDWSRPVDILTRLMVGSEGTLGLLAEATLTTVPLRAARLTSVLSFGSVEDATRSLPELTSAAARAIELLDHRSLLIAPGTDDLPATHVVGGCALLVEWQERDHDALRTATRILPSLAATLPVLGEPLIATDPSERAVLWGIRKGIYPTVAAARAPGTTPLLEDFAVPRSELAATTHGLRGLLDDFGYDESAIFGHARDGNLHFLLADDFNTPDGVERYERFTREMVRLVLAHNGNLKAEHGTGRAMAPFLLAQFGYDLHRVMRDIKDAFDPDGLLNPGVLISEDEGAHLRNLKTIPATHPVIDDCVECGFCEPVCPSARLSMTPRERIVVKRVAATAAPEVRDQIEAEYQYDGIHTCAVDGMCETRCPVGINTGTFIGDLRAESVGRVAQRSARLAARHWPRVTEGLRSALHLGHTLPEGFAAQLTQIGRRAVGSDVVPLWTGDIPAAARRARLESDGSGDPVDYDFTYLPSCLSAVFDTPQDDVASALIALSERAGLRARVVKAGTVCCGTPWKSKGLESGRVEMANLVAERSSTWEGTRLGVVVVDAASCTQGFTSLASCVTPVDGSDLAGTLFVDSVTFAVGELLPRLGRIQNKLAEVTLHPTCSSTREGTTVDLERLAHAVADQVFIPPSWGCCGFAGDRGWLHPELTATATELQAAEVAERGSTAYASCNLTCEIALSRATGAPYRHILTLLEEVTRPESSTG